jgi:hypothetical protein
MEHSAHGMGLTKGIPALPAPTTAERDAHSPPPPSWPSPGHASVEPECVLPALRPRMIKRKPAAARQAHAIWSSRHAEAEVDVEQELALLRRTRSELSRAAVASLRINDDSDADSDGSVADDGSARGSVDDAFSDIDINDHYSDPDDDTDASDDEASPMMNSWLQQVQLQHQPPESTHAVETSLPLSCEPTSTAKETSAPTAVARTTQRLSSLHRAAVLASPPMSPASTPGCSLDNPGGSLDILERAWPVVDHRPNSLIHNGSSRRWEEHKGGDLNQQLTDAAARFAPAVM